MTSLRGYAACGVSVYTGVLDKYASARTDKDAFNALEAWAKLKVVLSYP